ncbi:hypothetical protein A2U01_0102615, partial [Trifolium medium]|nr:hypothetical protein [Trifolium medium]
MRRNQFGRKGPQGVKLMVKEGQATNNNLLNNP